MHRSAFTEMLFRCIAKAFLIWIRAKLHKASSMAASIVSSHCMPCGGVNQSLTHHSSASIAAFLAPLLFGTIFCT